MGFFRNGVRGGLALVIGAASFTVFGLTNQSIASGVTGQTASFAWGAEAAITLGSNPVEIAAGENGSLWVVDSTDATLTEIADVAGVSTPQTPIPLETGSSPTGVTVDHDGNVWVGLNNPQRVQQFENVVGTWMPQPPIAVDQAGGTMRLVTAPDGSIWAVFRDTAKLQRIANTGGTWSAEPVLSSDRGIDELVFDTNGVGWLLYPEGAITKLSETGGVWSLGETLGTNNRTNWGAQGPNGSLYVSDGGCAFYQFDPETRSNTRTSWTDCAAVQSVATSSDSSIWLASTNGNVDRWSSTNLSYIERYVVGGQPRDLTRTTDGSMWFVNPSTHKVQRIAYRAPIASTITSTSSLTSAVGDSVNFTVTTSGGFPTPAIRTTDPLPYGVRLTSNADGTGTLVGSPRPGTEGVYSIAIEAVNGDLVTTQNFTLTVSGTPPEDLTVFSPGASGGWNTCEVNSMTATANANFWVSSPSEGKIFHYSTNPFTLVETLTVGGRPSQLTTATDGTVWFIDETNNNVRSISYADSTWTVDSAVTVGSSPRFLTAGANGSVWVADSVDATVRWIVNVGGVRSVADTVSIPGSTLAGLTKGLDGTIWAADRSQGRLHRIRYDDFLNDWYVAGSVTVSLSDREMILATGPDGDIWVAFRGTSTVQSVKNVNSSWTAQTALTASFGTYTIAAGPGGTIWVGSTEGKASQLFEQEDTWKILEPISAQGRTQVATATDDGALWWSDAGCSLFSWKSTAGVAPAITSAASGTMTIGSYSSLTLTATGTPRVTFSAVGALPSGLSFNVDPNNSQASFSGQLSDSVTPGDYTIKLIADNGAYRPAVQTFTLTVSAAPPSSSEAPPSSSEAPPSSSEAPTLIEVPTSPTVPLPSTPTTVSTPSSSVAPPGESEVEALPFAGTPLVADNSISAGAEVSVTFGGFVPGEFVQLIVASTPQVIGSGYADARGIVTLSGDIPASLTSGNHTLAVYAPASGIGFRQPITVAGLTLPVTGASNRLWPAMMLLCAGVSLIAASRRRHLI